MAQTGYSDRRSRRAPHAADLAGRQTGYVTADRPEKSQRALTSAAGGRSERTLTTADSRGRGGTAVRGMERDGRSRMTGYERQGNDRSGSTYGYIEGNTVRQPAVSPRRTEDGEEEERKRSAGARTRRNRARALQMNIGYVTFLTAASVLTLFLCVNYLRLQSQNTTYRNSVAAMTSQLSDLQAENDSAYESALASVDLDTIRDIAIGKLGMVYANEGQVRTYEGASEDYVRQYEDVPDE